MNKCLSMSEGTIGPGSESGCSPVCEKVQAIKEAPISSNGTELKVEKKTKKKQQAPAKSVHSPGSSAQTATKGNTESGRGEWGEAQ